MPSSWSGRSANRRNTPLSPRKRADPPGSSSSIIARQTATSTSAAAKRSTRSQSRQLLADADANVASSTTRAESVVTDASSIGSREEISRRTERVMVQRDLSPVNESPNVDDASDYEREGDDDSVVDDGRSESTGGLTSHSLVELSDLDRESMVDALPALLQNSNSLVKLFANLDKAQLGTLHDELQKPDSRPSRKLQDRLAKFKIDRQHYGDGTYIDLSISIRKLSNTRHWSQVSQGRWRPDAILQIANLAQFISTVFQVPRDSEEALDALQSVWSEFPVPFASGFDGSEEGKSGFGTTKLLHETAMLALELRTQSLFRMLLDRKDHAAFDPDDLSRLIFLTADEKMRGFDMQNDQAELAAHLETAFQKRLMEIREFFKTDPKTPVDWTGLAAAFPWIDFLCQLARWTQLRSTELREEVASQGGVDEIQEQLQNEAQNFISTMAPVPDREEPTSSPSQVPPIQLLPVATSEDGIEETEEQQQPVVKALMPSQQYSSQPQLMGPFKQRLLASRARKVKASVTEEVPQSTATTEETPQAAATPREAPQAAATTEEPPRAAVTKGEAAAAAFTREEARQATDTTEQAPRATMEEVRQSATVHFEVDDQPTLGIEEDVTLPSPQKRGKQRGDSQQMSQTQQILAVLAKQKAERNKENIDLSRNRRSTKRTFVDPQAGAERVSFDSDDAAPPPSKTRSPLKRRRDEEESRDSDGDEEDVFENDARVPGNAPRRDVFPVWKQHSVQGSQPESRSKRIRTMSPRRRVDDELVDNVANEPPESAQASTRGGRAMQNRALVRHNRSSVPWWSAPAGRRTSPVSQVAPSGVPASQIVAQAKAIVRQVTAKNAPKKVQSRRPYSDEEVDRLVELIEDYGVSWSQLLKEDQIHREGPVLGDRSQVNLKDKARNLKMDYLKAGQKLPWNFEHVALSRGLIEILDNLGVIHQERLPP